MTLIAAWLTRNPILPTEIMCAADGRVSRVQGANWVPATLVDSADKILPLHVSFHGHEFNFDRFEFALLHRTVLGFAYAGSALIPILTYFAAARAFQHVRCPTGEPPTLETLALWLSRILEHQLSEGAAVHPFQPCEVVLFGQSRAQDGHAIHRLTPTQNRDGSIQVAVTHHDFDQEAILLVGDTSRAPEFLRLVDDERRNLEVEQRARRERGDGRLWDEFTPLRAMARLAEEGTPLSACLSSVGGSVSFGWCRRDGVVIHSVLPRGIPPRAVGGVDVDHIDPAYELVPPAIALSMYPSSQP